MLMVVFHELDQRLEFGGDLRLQELPASRLDARQQLLEPVEQVPDLEARRLRVLLVREPRHSVVLPVPQLLLVQLTVQIADHALVADLLAHVSPAQRHRPRKQHEHKQEEQTADQGIVIIEVVDLNHATCEVAQSDHVSRHRGQVASELVLVRPHGLEEHAERERNEVARCSAHLGAREQGENRDEEATPERLDDFEVPERALVVDKEELERRQLFGRLVLAAQREATLS
mmetsp:Transcript_4918/g.8098  ORF Transcript_4918/g.8098 Transcript_4918/m.8098 type:complete len:230 (+) Transcript_4918:252-941(+)